MRALLARLWADDRGAVISVEMILVIGILLFGMIPGLVALRNSVNAFLGGLANIFASLTPTFTTTQLNVNGSSITAIVVIPGAGSGQLVEGQQVQPINPGDISISPAP